MAKFTLKRIGLGVLFIPIGFLLLFLTGEVLSGDISGFSHLAQALPIVFLAILSWKKPFLGGVLLCGAGIILGFWYATLLSFSFRLIFPVGIFLFLPLIISGILFILASKTK